MRLLGDNATPNPSPSPSPSPSPNPIPHPKQVRLHGDNATRRGAADALGERVALLQEQVASAQLDLEQSRHAAIAEKARASREHLESELHT